MAELHQRFEHVTPGNVAIPCGNPDVQLVLGRNLTDDHFTGGEATRRVIWFRLCEGSTAATE